MRDLRKPTKENVVRVQAQELVGDRAAEITRQFEDGRMILVLNEQCDESVMRNIIATFGFGTAATCSLFAISETGVSVDAADLSGARSPSVGEWIDGAVLRMQKSSYSGKQELMGSSAYPSFDGQQPDAMAPRMRITASGMGPDGFSYSSEVIVMRDAQLASDRKVVLARTLFDIKPVLQKGHKIQEFAVTSSIRSGSNVGFTRVGFDPKSDGRTDMSIEKQHERTVGYSFTAGLEVGGSVGSSGPELSSKRSFTFGYNRSRTDRQGISFVIKDYRLESNPQERADGTSLVELRSIRDPRAKEETPMGLAQHLEQLVHWEIDAGCNDIAAFRPALERLRMDSGTRSPFVAPALFIPMGSPYISRSPTVLIQSTAGDGQILAAQPNGIHVRLVPASSFSKSDDSAHWEFDAESRYINRKTGRALTMDPISGMLSLQKPTLDLTQRWEWRADRLHSQYADRVFRLTNELGRARAARSQDLPLNDENSLLPPWGQYPAKPVEGDTIPRWGRGTRPPILPIWPTQFDAVPESERWQLIILRSGLQ